MARPRKSAVVLQMSGAFKANPRRAREDLPGAAPSDLIPPSNLTQDEVKAWHYLVDRLPKVALTRSEELSVESAVRLFARQRAMKSSHEDFLKVTQLLLTHLTALGMTLASRAKLGSPPSGEGKANPFARIKEGA